MSTPPASRPVTAGDRLGLTLLLAVAVHGLLIFGLGFDLLPRIPEERSTEVEVVLVQAQSEPLQERTRRIAQVDQAAAGRGPEKARPGNPVSSPVPGPGQSPEDTPERRARPEPRDTPEILHSPRGERPEPVTEPRDAVPEKDTPDTAEMVERSLRMARLNPQITTRESDRAPRADTLYLDALSARSAVEAAYLEAWVRKVERVGNLNYPDEARRRRLTGSLVLSVLLDQEGRVLEIALAGSSGERVLDDAARRIVELAAPFAPFPPELRRAHDRIMITRTWVFKGNQMLRTR
ncbi:MAG: TonB family protein [Ectothiorhodospira sp.]